MIWICGIVALVATALHLANTCNTVQTSDDTCGVGWNSMTGATTTVVWLTKVALLLYATRMARSLCTRPFPIQYMHCIDIQMGRFPYLIPISWLAEQRGRVSDGLLMTVPKQNHSVASIGPDEGAYCIPFRYNGIQTLQPSGRRSGRADSTSSDADCNEPIWTLNGNGQAEVAYPGEPDVCAMPSSLADLYIVGGYAPAVLLGCFDNGPNLLQTMSS